MSNTEPRRVFAVRHIPSGLWLPKPRPVGGRGGSYVEPEAKPPRLFDSRRAAVSFLGKWLQGHHRIVRSHSMDFEGVPDDKEEFTIISQPHRKREDMEVVVFLLCEVAE